MNAISNRVVVKMSWFVVAVIVTCPVRAEAPTVQPVPDGYVGGPYKVIAAEFTGDAHIDLLIGYRGIGVFAILQGDGTGGMTHLESNVIQVPQAHGERHVHNLDHADLDNDGLVDAALTVGGKGPAHPGFVVLAKNLGRGKFQIMRKFETPSEAKGVRMADLDKDGHLDLVYTARGSGYTGDLKRGRLLMRQGHSNWSFGPVLESIAGKSAYFVDVADLNNDGFLDFVVPNEHDSTVTYFLNPGRALFQQRLAPDPLQVRATQIPGRRSHAINDARAVDLNGDSNPDLLTANLGTSTVSIFAGNGNGTFRKDTLLDAGKNGAFLAVGDLNRDGSPDFVITHWTEDFVSVFLNNGNGKFPKRKDYQTASGNYGVTLADLNQDKHLDIITANYRDRSISILIGKGAGTFHSATTTPLGLRSRGGQWTPE